MQVSREVIPLRQHLSLQLQIGIGLVVLVVLTLLALTGLELATEFKRGHELRAKVVESYETRADIQTVLVLLLDAETGVRGSMISQSPTQLGPYYSTVVALPPQLKKLRRRFEGRPAETAEMDRLARLATERLDILGRRVAAGQSGGVQASIAAAPLRTSKKMTDDARASIVRLRDLEAANLERYTIAAEERTLRTERLVMAMFVTLSLVIAAVFLLSLRYVITRKVMLADIGNQVARQQAIFDSTIDAIVTLNTDGVIETANAAAQTMFGYLATDIDQHDISLLIDVDSDGEGEFLKRLGASRDALEGGLIRQMEGRKSTGEIFPIDVALGAMHLHAGTHIVAVIRDASERKRIEQMKDEFVSTVSHELRTPLTSIAGSLGLLAGGAIGHLPEKADRLIQIAHSNSQRLVRLINDILDVEKIESGKLRLELSTLDLRDIAARSIEGVRGYADELGVTLALADGEPAPVRGDADRLIQVVTNLLSNASKFSPQGSVVRVNVQHENRLARISVTDQGPGIPDEFRPRIFTKFAQADGSNTRAKGGTGLGLTIAREIAERHGGRLWFESLLGAGSTFNMDLPLVGASTGVETAEPRLLLVKGEVAATAMLREMLKGDGFDADIATTRDQAMIRLRSGGYSAVLVDIDLPDTESIALIRDMRTEIQTRDIPVVVVTGDAAKAKVRNPSLEAVDWIEKPFDQARLRMALAAIYRRLSDRRPRVLHIDHDENILQQTASALSVSAEIASAKSLAEARALLAIQRPDLVILDPSLADGSGLELLADLRDRDVPIIVYSEQDMDMALSDRVDVVLTKSGSSLASLANAARRLTAMHDPKREPPDANSSRR